MKSSRRIQAIAVALVALLHGAVLLWFARSALQTPRPRQVDPTAALPHTLIRVALGSIKAPGPLHQRTAYATQTSAKRDNSPRVGPTPAVQPEQQQIAVAAAEPASSPASAPLPSKADAPFIDPAYLDNPPPAYPSASLRAHEQGRVLVSVLVSVHGLVEDANVKESSGSARLDAAALTSVRAWRFVPAQRSGVAVAARINVPVRFELSVD